MKKLILIIVAMLIATPASAKTWTLFFVDQEEDIGDGVMGFVVGEGAYTVAKSQVSIIRTVGANHMFIYVTQSTALASQVRSYTEFRGYNYIDMVWRVARGIGDGTLNELEYITGAHWYVGGEWYFGDIKAYEAAGEPVNVWFGPYKGILGVEIP